MGAPDGCVLTGSARDVMPYSVTGYKSVLRAPMSSVLVWSAVGVCLLDRHINSRYLPGTVDLVMIACARNVESVIIGSFHKTYWVHPSALGLSCYSDVWEIL